MTELAYTTMTADAAADLACGLIEEFVRCYGGALRSHDIFILGEAHGMVRKVQALISAGWMSGQDADDILNSEVTFAVDLLADIRNQIDN